MLLLLHLRKSPEFIPGMSELKTGELCGMDMEGDEEDGKE